MHFELLIDRTELQEKVAKFLNILIGCKLQSKEELEHIGV